MKIKSSLLALLLALSPTANADLTGRVIAVLDGDTIEVLPPTLQPVRVRLANIDAPEKRQPFGARAKQHLATLVYQRQVDILSDSTDRYGRTIGMVRLQGADVNREMIAAGMAWAYRAYLRDQSLLAIEAAARQQQKGLWQDPAPIPPWDYRANTR